LIQKTARALLLTSVLVGALATVMPQSALAISATPDRTGWSVSGKVYAYAHYGNVVYAGGSFKRVNGPIGTKLAVKNIAAFDATTGAPISSFLPTVTNTAGAAKVSSLAVSLDGATLYIGGQFNTVDGQTVSNFAAIDTGTGDLVPGFNVSINQAVDVLLAGPNLLYMGGAFTKVNGEARGHLAAIAYNGTLSETWTPSTAAGNCPAPYYNASTCSNGGNGDVRSLALSPDGNFVYVGGEFYYVTTSAGTTPRNCLARVSAVDGSLDAWTTPNWTDIVDDAQSHKPGPNMAWQIIPTATRVYVGFGRVPNYLQVFRTDNGNSANTVFKVGTPGNVESLALWTDPNTGKKTLFVGGHFGTAVLDYYVSQCGTYAHGLVSFNIPTVGDTLTYNCAWMPTLKPYGGQSAPGSHVDPPNYVGGWTMFQSNNALWIGGYFTSVAGTAQSGIAKFTLSGTPPPPAPVLGTFSPTKGPAGTVVTIPGFGFTGTTDVQFGGVSATTFTVNNDGQITATVPSGAITGPITVVAPGGTVNSGTKKFHVTG